MSAGAGEGGSRAGREGADTSAAPAGGRCGGGGTSPAPPPPREEGSARTLPLSLPAASLIRIPRSSSPGRCAGQESGCFSGSQPGKEGRLCPLFVRVSLAEERWSNKQLQKGCRYRAERTRQIRARTWLLSLLPHRAVLISAAEEQLPLGPVTSESLRLHLRCGGRSSLSRDPAGESAGFHSKQPKAQHSPTGLSLSFCSRSFHLLVHFNCGVFASRKMRYLQVCLHLPFPCLHNHHLYTALEI